MRQYTLFSNVDCDKSILSVALKNVVLDIGLIITDVSIYQISDETLQMVKKQLFSMMTKKREKIL